MSLSPHSFPKSARLLTSAQYSRVFEQSKRRASTRHALLLALSSNEGQSSRLGLVVAKKNVRLAHERNRIKRLVREYFRCHPTETPMDLIFLARRGVAELTNQQIGAQLDELWSKLGRQPR